MAVASYLLVTMERTDKASRAGLFYAVMTHLRTAFTIALYFILYHTIGIMEFDGMKASIAGMPDTVKSAYASALGHTESPRGSFSIG